MRFRCSSRDDSDIIQNRFTAYLLAAVRNKREAFLQKRLQVDLHEYLVDLPNAHFEESDFAEEYFPSLKNSFDNDALEQAFNQLGERERFVLFARILEEKSFTELASELGLTYKGTAAIYYRAIQKLRKRIRGETL